MKISENTIEEIIRHGDSTTLYEIIRTLIQSLKDRDKRLKAQGESMARTRTLFLETEADLDRFRRMTSELLSLCEEVGQEEKARGIVRFYGGADEFDHNAEPDEVDEITIELD